jgi:hypothetical protein
MCMFLKITKSLTLQKKQYLAKRTFSNVGAFKIADIAMFL